MFALRRALAGLLLSIATFLGSIAFAGWWFSRTVLDTSRTASVTTKVLKDSTVRHTIAQEISNVVFKLIPVSAGVGQSALTSGIESVLNEPALSAQLANTVTDLHRHLIGEAKGKVTLDPSIVTAAVTKTVPGLDPKIVAAIPSVSFSVPEASWLGRARDDVPGVVTVLAAIALLSGGVGVLISVRRGRSMRQLGFAVFGMVAAELIFLWIIPVYLLPAIWDSPGAGVISSVATVASGGLIGALLALAALGGLLIGLSIPAERAESAMRNMRRQPPTRAYGPTSSTVMR